MISPAWGPFLFDTSAESWIARPRDARVVSWLQEYLSLHEIHVSATTVLERIRGYGLLVCEATGRRREQIEGAQVAYLTGLGKVLPVDTAVAIVAGEIMARIPNPLTSPRRTHRLVESRQDRLVRWRFDVMIAATALTHRMTLVHNNAADFEAIRAAVETSPERFPGIGPLVLIRCDSLAG
jgi:predicted nucleic acid-binding protein